MKSRPMDPGHAQRRSDARLRKRCARLVADLDLPRPFELPALARALAAERGRPIQLCPMPMPADAPSGMWVATRSADYICYETDTSALQQIHIVLHELGHVLLAHDAPSVLSAHTSRALFPDLDPALVRSMMGRHHYTAVQEREAEITASLIARKAGIGDPEPEPRADPSNEGPSGIAARIRLSLEGRGPR